MKNLMKDFKKLLIQHKDIIYHYFKYTSIKSRNFKNKNIDIKKSKKDSIISISQNQNQNQNLNINPNPNSNNNPYNYYNPYSSSISKSEFINNYNKNFYNLIDKNSSKLEFHISFGTNLIQSVCFCENCNMPNTIWDIRKEFKFSKNRRETKTKCKFCDKFYLPYFLIIEETIENNNINNYNNFNYNNNLNERRDKRKIALQTNHTNFNGKIF
jgi:hypothetical protein